MPFQAMVFLSRAHVPEVNAVVRTGRSQRPAIARKGNASPPMLRSVRFFRELNPLTPCCDLPERENLIGLFNGFTLVIDLALPYLPGGQHSAVRRKRQGANPHSRSAIG